MLSILQQNLQHKHISVRYYIILIALKVATLRRSPFISRVLAAQRKS